MNTYLVKNNLDNNGDYLIENKYIRSFTLVTAPQKEQKKNYYSKRIRT